MSEAMKAELVGLLYNLVDHLPVGFDFDRGDHEIKAVEEINVAYELIMRVVNIHRPLGDEIRSNYDKDN